MSSERVKYSLDDQGRFCIEDYNWAKPMSNFLPGIAGKWGIPMWVYYVSKNQGVCSFGIKDKDHAIMEFLSFNKACQSVGDLGFRTFIKFNEKHVYEAFRKTGDPAITQRMFISSHELELEEINQELGIKTNVVYFNLVNLPLPGLVRRVTITDLSDQDQNIEILDGAPRIIPYGVTFEHLKVIARHIEGMMGVFEVDGVPIFRLKQTAADIEEIGSLDGGNFYCALTDDGCELNTNIIIDPKVLYGEIEQLDYPWRFANEPAESLMKMQQVKENRTPCGMSLISKSLSAGESVGCDSVIGYVDSQPNLRDFIKKIRSENFLDNQRDENKEIIDKLKQGMLTISAVPAFDQYCQQNYLDNVMRGGIPLILESEGRRNSFYHYIRQGGDLERDYHWFVLEPSYLSQGNGHYRNVLQNRRMDNWLYPEIYDHNIQTFMNLIQLDGYNPLVVEGVTYTASDPKQIKGILKRVLQDDDCINSLLEYISKAFTPGEFLMKLEGCTGELDQTYEELLAEILIYCQQEEIGALHEGFWIDHWFYNLDLMESFLAVFPDRVSELLLDNGTYSFFDNYDVVQPRAKKAFLVEEKVRQYGAVLRDPKKQEMIAARAQDAYKVHTRSGHGEVYTTNLLVKFLCLLTNKIASLDPCGLGVEMEAGKPGWCDSLNGLPGLFGSSICETLELIRLCRLLISCFGEIKVHSSQPQMIYEELHTFMQFINQSLSTYRDSEGANRALAFWIQTHNAKETYREKTRFGITGDEVSMPIAKIEGFIVNCLQFLETKIEETSEDAFFLNGVPYTYFRNPVSEYTLDSSPPIEGQNQNVDPKAFQQIPVSLFLEGPTHYIRMFPDQAEFVHKSVKLSDIYDKKLKTFKVCSTLGDESYELGRIKAYPSGWIENESIYTHMQYKWLLELLRAGLHEQFFQEIKNTFPPFLDPHVYGRSILENCSFIASSAHPDASIHGQGFQPRFSGVTAEFINIWLLMTVGQKPFSISGSNKLQFQLEPILPAWLFTQEETKLRYWKGTVGWGEITIPADSFAFHLLGETLVIYHNPKQRPTFGADAVDIHSYRFIYKNGDRREIQGVSIGEPFSKDVRKKEIQRIDILLDG